MEHEYNNSGDSYGSSEYREESWTFKETFCELVFPKD